MLIIAITLFALAALLGIYLISFVLMNKNTPKGVVFIHGPVAALALILLIIYAVTHQPSPWLSIILFALAAVGGFTMVYRDLTGKTLPKWLAMGHGLLAVVGFISLVFFTFSH